jgi:hypothetical protein
MKNGISKRAENCACPAILSGIHSGANENTSVERQHYLEAPYRVTGAIGYTGLLLPNPLNSSALRALPGRRWGNHKG